MAVLLLLVGALVALVGVIGVLVQAFRAGLLWGLLSLFLPIVYLVFALTHWDKAGRPFLLHLLGVFLMGVARALGG